MKHRNLTRTMIAAAFGLVGLLGSANSGFAQNFATRQVQGLFGTRTLGESTMAPNRLVATGAPVGLDGQPLGFDRARGTLLPSSGQGWAFGAIAPNAILPWSTTQLTNTSFPVFGGGNGTAALGMGGGGGIFPMPPNVPLPTSAAGASPQTPNATTPNAATPGQPANVSGQNAGQMQSGTAAANAAGQSASGQTAQTPGGAGDGHGRFCADGAGAVEHGLSSRFHPQSGRCQRRLTTRLQNSKDIQKRSPLSVTLEQDTAVIRGRVATEHDRDLAAAMLRLEPGVGDVRNELVVESPPAPQGVSSR